MKIHGFNAKNFVICRDVVFHEVSSWQSDQKTILMSDVFYDDQDNLELSSQNNMQAPCNDYFNCQINEKFSRQSILSLDGGE